MATKLVTSRKVSDIMDSFGGPIAFDQVKVGVYQPICPWCAEDQGDYVLATTFSELYEACLEPIKEHVLTSGCARATRMAVCTQAGGMGHLSQLYKARDNETGF